MRTFRKYSSDHPMAVACRDAINKAGGYKLLAARLNRTWQAIYHWEVVPTEHVLEVSRLSGISVHVLRPDKFGAEPERRRARLTA
jgi:Putative antitoxin of bacterial toxin-antitoxin system, YdaS/YdaT